MLQKLLDFPPQRLIPTALHLDERPPLLLQGHLGGVQINRLGSIVFRHGVALNPAQSVADLTGVTLYCWEFIFLADARPGPSIQFSCRDPSSPGELLHW